MAIAINYTPRSMTTAQYDQVIQTLEEAGLGAPAGRLYHIVYGTDPQLRVLDLFASQETFEGFVQGLGPTLQSMGIELANLEVAPVHNLIRGSEDTPGDIGARFAEAMTRYWQSGDPSELDAVFAPAFVDHTPGLPPNLAGLKQVLPAFRSAFPDFQISAQEVLAGDGRAVTRVRWQGTHRGELLGLPPTGRSVTVTETHIYRLVDNKIAERWGQWDQMGLMQQLGAIPQPEPQAV